jgi:hypothetical protein
VLNLETKNPENGSPNREPIGKINRSVPNSASFNYNTLLIVGILDAQEAKSKPDKKKNDFKKSFLPSSSPSIFIETNIHLMFQ